MRLGSQRRSEKKQSQIRKQTLAGAGASEKASHKSPPKEARLA